MTLILACGGITRRGQFNETVWPLKDQVNVSASVTESACSQLAFIPETFGMLQIRRC